MGNEPSAPHRGLTDKEIRVLKTNSNFNEEEIKEFYEEFKHECPSGRMNKVQFKKYYHKMVDPEGKNSNVPDLMFPVFDQNGDGTVDFGEFVLASAAASRNDLDSQLDLAFSLIDTSGDGNISYDELKKFLTFAKQISEKDNPSDMNPDMVATMIFSMFGLNKQQKLSKKQFIDGIKSDKHLQEILGKFRIQ